MTRRFSPIVLSLLFALGLAPGAGAQKTKSSAQPPARTQTVGPDYLISAGDVLDVQVWKEPDISKTVPVRPDGKVSIPLLDDVQAAGLTTNALTADLTDRLKKFISDPQVTVIVAQVNSQRFYITGEVLRGGAFPLEPGMTMLQGLSSAGGFTPFANLKKIYLLRGRGAAQVKYPFNYKEVVKGKNTAQNVLLQPGDTIVVP